MGDKRKKTFMFIRLVSTAGIGFFYVMRKSAKGVAEKLEFRKYDRRVNRHVLFTEQKMKYADASGAGNDVYEFVKKLGGLKRLSEVQSETESKRS